MPPIRVGIVGGTGAQGRGLALRWGATAEVILGSRDPQRAVRLAEELAAAVAGSIRGASNLEAIGASDLVFLALPYAARERVLPELAPALAGKIVVDMTVPLDPSRPSVVRLPPGGAAALELRELLGGRARIVAALHNISAARLAAVAEPLRGDALVCSDDDAAKAEVIALIGMLGLRGLDAGPLVNAIAAESLTPVLIHINRRYGAADAGIEILGIPSAT